jgi:hypothetical protein
MSACAIYNPQEIMDEHLIHNIFGIIDRACAIYNPWGNYG